jgi:hypothetical protein
MKSTIPLIFLLSTSLFSQEKVSNAELSQKLNLILGKLDILEERVTKLESENLLVKEDIKEVSKSAKDAIIATENLSSPKDAQKRKSFFKKLRIEMESDADTNRGPWTQKETWKEMKRNLTGHKVRMLLGNPNKIKGDLSPRIEQVYIYSGDLDADGVDEIAKVNFYRDRVVSFESPFGS